MAKAISTNQTCTSLWLACAWFKVETKSGLLGHVLYGSSWSDLIYIISGYDPDSALDYVLVSSPDELSMLDDDGCKSPDSPQDI